MIAPHEPVEGDETAVGATSFLDIDATFRTNQISEYKQKLKEIGRKAEK